MEKVVVIGAGGHGKVVADIIRKSGDRVVGFLDDGKGEGTDFFGSKILGKTEDAEKFSNYSFIIAIGNNKVRERIAQMRLKFYTAIHPAAVIAEGARLGEGTAVMACAVINPDTVIGKHCIINTGAVVEHDCILGDYVHISPGAVLCGTVNVAERSWVGAGAVVKNNQNICEDVVIGAGATVVGRIAESGVYVGVPAKKIK